ncbi:MAG: PA14 domain-containing protein [Planctomycetota bacterium]
MGRKLISLALVALVLSLAGAASAAIPAGWTSQDIGSSTGGSADEAGGIWTVSGNGNDIWGNADAFHFAYVPLSGDGQLVARVTDNGTGSNAWAKGGVMIRETLEAGSMHAMMVVTGGNGGGAGFQRRLTTGAASESNHDQAPTVAPPHWVKIVREGNEFSGYRSLDGVEWTQQGITVTIDMATEVYIGLCVTSHAAGEVRTFTFDNVSTELPKVALRPVPEDGALYADTWVNLAWNSGSTAASHDVYIGVSFDDVNDGAGDTFQGNQTSEFLVVGFPGFEFSEGLAPGTTYYWRVDEVEADGTTTHKGKVWSFFIPSLTAYQPVPADGAAFVATDITLSWQTGFNAKLHTVYFGDDFDTVANATGGLPQGDATFAPDALEMGKTYYWRVDELDPPATNTGAVWSFTTTLPGLGTAVMDRWENMTGTDINTLKDSPKYPNNPDVTETVNEFKWDGADLADYGARIEAWVYAPATGAYTFWLNSDDQGELWLSTDDDSSNAMLIAQETNYSGLNAWGTGEEQSEPIELVGGEKYYIMAIWKEGGGGDHCQVAWQGPGIPDRMVIPGGNLSPFEPVSAYGAKPANRAVGVTQTPVLRWKAGLQAESHEVYFGTDEAAVAGATKASPEYKGSKALGDESFEPGKLDWETNYYWRVDEINATNADSPWVGNVLSFTTAGFLIVDDFEDYTDNDAANEAIWQTWIDGFGVNTNGSQVGYVMPPYAEQSTVQAGRQAMPLFYSNIAGVTNSEAELTLTARDWTEGGVANLSIWFHGQPGSTGGFVESPAGTFTMSGSGTDIWGSADEFHFAYKTLTGAGTIVARVDSVDRTHNWAKAGVMIRESLDAGSKFAGVYITPTQDDDTATNGCRFQARIDADASAVSDSSVATDEQMAIVAPYWVKLERDVAGNFRGSYSSDGTTWQSMVWNPQNIAMGPTVYVGLAVTSHDVALTSEAVFSNVTITGSVAGQWTNQDIGIDSNAAEPMYVAVSNAGGTPAVVTHDDPAAAQIDAWTEWIIELSKFSDQGINLSNVDKIAIGLGDKGGASAGGSGIVYIDSITLRRPAE